MSRAWMPLYVGDFLADTMHLGATERGIYISLLMHCWQHGTIPNDDRRLARISGCDSRLWRQYRETVLQFFDVVDAVSMQHKRVSTELRRCAEISSKRKAAAEQKHSKRSPNAEHLHTQSQSQSQSHSELRSEKKERARALTWPFEQFWEKYPHKVGKQDAQKAFEKAERSGATTFPNLMLGLSRYVDKTDDRPWCNPATWLNQGRWDDQPAQHQQMQRTGPVQPFAPRPGSKEDTRERTVNAIAKLSDYVDAHAHEQGRGGGAREANAGLLPFAEPSRS